LRKREKRGLEGETTRNFGERMFYSWGENTLKGIFSAFKRGVKKVKRKKKRHPTGGIIVEKKRGGNGPCVGERTRVSLVAPKVPGEEKCVEKLSRGMLKSP